MKFKFPFRIIIVVISLIFLGFLVLVLSEFYKYKNQESSVQTDTTRTVYIKRTEAGYQLIRNGKPFYIKGAAGNSHLDVLSDIGGNTIRVYDTLNLSNVLDEAQRNDLAVIVDIPLPYFSKDYCSYLNEDSNKVLVQKVRNLVVKHRNHSALLFWNLGNEIRYPSVRYKKLLFNILYSSYYKEENGFIETFNKLIDVIHEEDPNHPVSTVVASNLAIKSKSIAFYSPRIDLLGYNVFGRINHFNTSLQNQFQSEKIKPYFISEWGFDGPWECEVTAWDAPIEPTSSKKSEQIRERYQKNFDSEDGPCLGSLIFYWGEKQERTHTWYSFFKDDYKSESITELEKLWKDNKINRKTIGLEYMLVDGKGGRDTILCVPNQKVTAEIKFNGGSEDSLSIYWEVFTEDWKEYRINIDIPVNKVSVNFNTNGKNKVNFIVPDKEGPYRIYAYVYDQHGYFATANTPFYVLKRK